MLFEMIYHVYDINYMCYWGLKTFWEDIKEKADVFTDPKLLFSNIIVNSGEIYGNIRDI
jgi:hypothetical protein